MLVLTRREGESLKIGDDIRVVVVNIKDQGGVRLGIVAPKHIKILREELLTTEDQGDGPDRS